MMEDFITSIVIPIAMGLIPAFIAKKKGRNFYLWWLYGWLLFVIATIHALLMKDRGAAHPADNQVSFQKSQASHYETPVVASRQRSEDILKQYKVLLDVGILTKEEYQAKKAQLQKHTP